MLERAFMSLYDNLCHVTTEQCATADPDGQKRALVVGGGIANFTDVAATFNGIIRAMKEKVTHLLFFFFNSKIGKFNGF